MESGIWWPDLVQTKDLDTALCGCRLPRMAVLSSQVELKLFR